MSFNIPSFPDVPIALGVPPVLRNVKALQGSLVNSAENVLIGAAQNGIAGIISNVQSVTSGSTQTLINGEFGDLPIPMTSDSSDVMAMAASSPGQWGVFGQDGASNLSPDSIKAFDYQHSWRLPNYPMEKGAFQSYNKVQMPFQSRVTMTKGGSEADRTEFLNAVETAANSTNLYDVVTPEITYPNVSIESYNYKRTNVNGVTMLTFDLMLLEIRLAPPSDFNDTASANGADQVNGGVVQAMPITIGSDATAANITAGVLAGTPLSTTISSLTQVATTSLPTSSVSSIVSTLTPAVSAQLGSIVRSGSPIAATVAQQASLLPRIL